MRRHPSPVLSSLLALAALGLVAARPRAQEGCVTLPQWEGVHVSLEDGTACNEQALLAGAGDCAASVPPACSQTLVADTLALAWGAERAAPVAFDPGALSAQFACQQAIGRAAADYVSERLRMRIDRISPSTADAEAAPLLDPILTSCAVIVASDTQGVVRPAVGPQCAAAAGAPGAAVDPERLRDCLHDLLGLWVERVGPSRRPLRPNVVLILTDDQRYDTVGSEHGAAGADVMPSVRAALAGEGIEFTRAFVTTPLCCPSRASILTGRYAHHTGVLDNESIEAFDESSTLATWLSDAGYRTGLYGKYLNGYRGIVLGGNPYVPPGWDEWHAFVDTAYYDYSLLENGVLVSYGATPEEYSTDVLRDKALAFVRDSVARGAPFYLHFSPIAPHRPAIPAPRHEGRFEGVAPHRPPSWNEADASDKPGWVRNQTLSAGELDFLDATRRDMLETLLAVDEAITALIGVLRDEGVLDDTLVIFLSDNGYHWGEHRLAGKGAPYEESIRTPLFVRYPRLAPLARTESRLAANVDLAPTIAELAGATPTHPVDGRSLVRLLDGTARNWRTHVLHEGWTEDTQWSGVREERWKFGRHAFPASDGTWIVTGEELYDLASDPFELENLARRPDRIAERDRLANALAALRPETFACADGRDNDGDGRVDLNDRGCDAAFDHNEWNSSCGLGFELVLLAPLLARLRRLHARRGGRRRASGADERR
jgi:arylsulfatase A-like enzyme